MHLSAIMFKGGGQHESHILAGLSHLRFKQSRISMLIRQIYVLGRFVNFLVIFRYIWR